MEPFSLWLPSDHFDGNAGSVHHCWYPICGPLRYLEEIHALHYFHFNTIYWTSIHETLVNSVDSCFSLY